MRTKTLVLGSMLAVACGGPPGARPNDMSAAAHGGAAEQHESLATTHAGQFDPSAAATSRDCAGKPGAGPCWTVGKNPTAGHSNEADEHRKMAADHRSASKALRDVETNACAGLAEADRDSSPFEHRDDVLGVEELRAKPPLPKGAVTGPVEGASVTIRAVPGLTKEYLQRLVTCHSARNATMGHGMPEMAFCPLAVKGATATVDSAGGGFRVDIKGDTPQASDEIARRARALTAGT